MSEAVCGGVGRGKSVLQTGTTRSREVFARVGVTSDEAENAPRLRVANGEDSQESKPPVKRRVETHTANAQGSSAPVPWRWGSRTGNRRLQRTRPFPRGYLDRGTPGSLLMAFPGTGNKGLQGTSPSQLGQRTEVISLPGSPGRAPSPGTATDLSAGCSSAPWPVAPLCPLARYC
jgi:hypothetical protein